MRKNYNDSFQYSSEDDTPLYSIEENDLTRNVDDLADDDNEDDIEDPNDDDDSNDDAVENKKNSPSSFHLLIRTMLTPVEGWKSLKRAKFKSDEVASGCFYPIIALAAVAEVARIFYEANTSISDWAVNGMTTFITFFFGYFTVLFCGAFLLPKAARPLLKKDIGQQFVMYNMSTLAIFWIAIRLLPMLEPVLVFLPLWTIYLIYKGVRVIRVPYDVENSTTGLLCMLIIGAPLLWNWLLTEILLPLTLH